MAEYIGSSSTMRKTTKKRSKKKAARKPAVKKAAKKTTKKASSGGRRPGRKPYPVMTFEEVLKIGAGIMEKASGEPVKRTTLLSELDLTNNNNTRNMITTSGKYGITSGSHGADKLSLTETGKVAVDPAKSEASRRRARFQLGIESVDAFKTLYEKYKGKKIPSLQVMEDDLDELNQSDRAHCVEIFIQNAKFIGLLKPRDGAEFLYRVDDAVAHAGIDVGGQPGIDDDPDDDSNRPSGDAEDFEKVCFFIAPIGSKGDETRKHSDAILTSYVEKALESVDPKLKVVRADKIDQPGMISKQVIEYILKSRIVVADLSYLNPNVFYELALRHATGKPTVHIKRDEYSIPFDTNNFRTIEIKFGDKFDILAELETVRTTIATHARTAIAAGSSTDNPILTYCPGHRFARPGEAGADA